MSNCLEKWSVASKNKGVWDLTPSPPARWVPFSLAVDWRGERAGVRGAKLFMFNGCATGS